LEAREATAAVTAVLQAVVDRIVDGVHVVLLVGPEEEERVVPRSLLPEGVREGTWLKVRFEGDLLVWAVIDEEATKAAAERVAAKLEQLRRRGRRLQPVDGGAAPADPRGDA